jgi:hypothetical protein
MMAHKRRAHRNPARRNRLLPSNNFEGKRG